MVLRVELFGARAAVSAVVDKFYHLLLRGFSDFVLSGFEAWRFELALRLACAFELILVAHPN